MNLFPRFRPTVPGRRSASERRVRERRVLAVGLAVSLAVHVLLIAVASRWLEPEPRDAPPGDRSLVIEPSRAMRAVEVAATPDEEAALADPRDPARPRDQRREVVVRVDPAEVVPVDPEHRRTAAERLAPRIVDPRLWQPMVMLPRQPTLADVQERVGVAVEMLSDSALADAERAMRARDWTVEDGSGGRWGISPGKLHLGHITVPLPVYFPVDMQAEMEQAYWYELETQLERALFLESFDSRVRAIRERRDRERAERRGEGGGE